MNQEKQLIEKPLSTAGQSFKAVHEAYGNLQPDKKTTISLDEDTELSRTLKSAFEAFLEGYFGVNHLSLEQRTVSFSVIDEQDAQKMCLGKLGNIDKLFDNPYNNTAETGLYIVFTQTGNALSEITIFFSDGQAALSSDRTVVYAINLQEEQKAEKIS